MNKTQQAISSIISGYSFFLSFSVSFLICFGLFMLMSMGHNTETSQLVIGSIGLILLIAYHYEITVYYKAFARLAVNLDEVGQNAIRYLRIAVWMGISTLPAYILAIFLYWALSIDTLYYSTLPCIATTLNIVFSLKGYRALSKSSSLNEQGKAGATNLYLATVIYSISALSIFVFLSDIFTIILEIPAINLIFINSSIVLAIIHWIMFFRGWDKIRSSFAIPPQESPQIQ